MMSALTKELNDVRASDTDARKLAALCAVAVAAAALALAARPAPWFGASGAMLAIAAVYPRAWHPIYRAWMTVALVIGFVMFRVFLVALYGIVFVPMGMIARLSGRDALNLRVDRSAGSYWTEPADSDSVQP